MAEPVLAFQKVTKRYGARTILDEVTFAVGKGERIALMGPSGSGKSTLLNCASAIDLPDTGEVLIEGRPIADSSEQEQSRIRRESVATIFQFFHLLPHLTAYENVELPLQLLGITPAERAVAIEEMLQAVQVEHRAKALPEAMSGGELQRIAIARAMVIRPQVILADEPVGNLDSKTGETILDLIESLSEKYGTALLMATHSDASTRICHRVLHLLDGVLAEQAHGVG